MSRPPHRSGGRPTRPGAASTAASGPASVSSGRSSGAAPNADRGRSPVEPRRLAHEALVRIDVDGAYANLLVPSLLRERGSAMADRDRHLVTTLVYGTVRMQRAVDHLVDRFLVSDPPPEARAVLRLGAYQFAFLGTPAHAAVSTSVDLAPKRLRPFVNAVLRKVVAAPVEFPDVGTRLSYPDWIVRRLVADLGESDALAALEAMNDPATTSVREDGYTQDRASQWVAGLVPATAGARVADLCAAPGGKATALAAAGADVVAVELHPHRAGLVTANAQRTGTSDRLHVVVADATIAPLRPAAFDHVVLDAPCSGLGALRRRPDARWRITESDVDDLAALQRRMLDAAAALVRPGGTVTYAVCTLLDAESLALDPQSWRALPPPGSPWRPAGRGARLLPQDEGTDGMTVLRYEVPAL